MPQYVKELHTNENIKLKERKKRENFQLFLFNEMEIDVCMNSAWARFQDELFHP